MYTAQSNVTCFIGDELIANIIRSYFNCTDLFLSIFKYHVKIINYDFAILMYFCNTMGNDKSNTIQMV